MTIAAGSRLGPYEIITLIGAGGMGEVYRANDSRLGREVAVKVLPLQFSTDSDRLHRFEQEARAAGMLNHPNIVTVYDIGTENGTTFVVSELLSGETLRERMGGSPLPVRKAIEYALQIANGLAAAHEKEIVHRDLKPENIFLTKDGRAKILDFGLAKLTAKGVAIEGQSKLQTLDRQTEPGMVLGTVGYMSPEQVRGREADHRSDIFAFGAILYEMLTGKRAFHRDSTADTMSAILKEDPADLSTTNSQIPPSMERVVRHCLEKNAEERFQSARDLAFDLQMVSAASGTTPLAPIESMRSPKTMRRIAFAAIAILAIIAAFFAGRQTATKPAKQTTAIAITDNPFQRLTFRRGYISAARFTPDGQSVIYSASWVGAPHEIFITRPQNPVSRSLGITNAVLLSVSSTGEMAILLEPRFTTGWQLLGTLARAPIDGGAPREILKDVQDADFSPDGKELAVIRSANAKYQMEYPIGKKIYAIPNGWMNNLRISPDGKMIAFMEHSVAGDDRGTINMVDLQGKVTKLTDDFASESGLHWSHDGKEIWFTASPSGSNEQPIYAVNLQGQRRLVVAMTGNLILHDMDSKDVALLTRDTRRRELIGLPPGETKERDLSWFDWSFSRYLSPDGKTIVFEEQGAGGGPNYTAFIRKTDGSPAVKLGEGFATSLSPDGSYITSIMPNDLTRLLVLPTGAGESRVIQIPGITFTPQVTGWFDDGKRILVAGYQKGKALRWWVYGLRDSSLKPVTPESTANTPNAPALVSPDQNSILTRSPEGDLVFYSLNGEVIRKAQGLEANEAPIRWAPDHKSVYVANGRQIPVVIYRVNLDTGQRSVWKEITPADISGIVGQIGVVMSEDGQSYAYTYRRVLSDLYLVPGLK